MTLDPQHSPQMGKRQLLSLMTSQKIRRLEDILNLSAIQLQTSQSLDLPLCNLMRRLAFNLCIYTDSAAQEPSPNRLSSGVVEGRVLERHVDSALEGLIHIFDAVGGEEEDT